ncbi:MAG: arylsulfatase, partial [Verrucomicrobiae bacterium]|nr:arylsulfatase [Verrucomicrobiae bacterium]
TFSGHHNSDIEDGKIKPDAPEEQLYNLRSDTYQHENVIRQYPEIAQTMKEHLAHLREIDSSR